MKPDATTGDSHPASVAKLTSLLALSHDLASELDLDRLLATIMSRTSHLLEADRSTLFLVDEAEDQLWSRVAEKAGINEIRFSRSAGIAGHVATTGETINIPDAYADTRFNQAVDRQTGYRTRSILCMPVRDVRGVTVGVLQVLNKSDGPFRRDDEDLLRVLCSHVAVALTNANLVEARRKEIEKTTILLDVMRSLASEIQLDPLLARIMDKTTEVMQADRSSLYIVDQRTNELWFKVAQGSDLQEMRFPVGVGIAGQVAATGEVVNIADAHDDPRFNPEMDRRTGYRTRSMLCMPMRDSAGKIVGVLQVLNKREGLFTGEDEELLAAVASQAVIALENARLFDDVMRMKNYNESILRSMATGVITIDMNACITTANAAAERILAFDGGAPIGAMFESAIGGGVLNAGLWDPVSRALEFGETRQVQKVKHTTEIGNPVTLNASAVPLRDAKEQQIGVVAVIEDISREQQLIGTLSRVVSHQVAEQIMATGLMPSVGGHRKQVTILMSDIRDFTTMTESAEPEDIVRMLNDYFGRMIEVIFDHEGTLDKFIGDAIMAVFGTPLAHTDDPMRAVKSAVDMRRALHAYNIERAAQGKPTIENGIGICDGEAVAGAIGSEQRLEFTVIGDAVNTAARIEGLTKGFPDHKIVFNEAVYELVKEEIPSDFLAEEHVKGKALPVRVYGVPEWYVLSGVPSVAEAAPI
ncbi:MAG: adenylate/guanylate cyclase with and sensor [Chloroflexi bacterium]|nr:adenylate/guanylate cyclase with and sensor [Chloroflexota bacterium]